MTIQNFILSHSWYFGTWSRPLGSGTLWSQSSLWDIYGEEKSIHWGIRNEAVEFDDTVRNFYHVTDSEAVELFEWNNLALQMKYWASEYVSILSFYRNGLPVAYVQYPYVFQDPPAESLVKRLGALERAELLLNHYHGHIYEFYAYPDTDVQVVHDAKVATTCIGSGGCSVCPLNGQCLND